MPSRCDGATQDVSMGVTVHFAVDDRTGADARCELPMPFVQIAAHPSLYRSIGSRPNVPMFCNMLAVAEDVEARLDKALRDAGAIRSRDLEAAGISRAQISRLVGDERLLRIGHGIYASPDYQATEHSALVAVARRAPQVVFCQLTAPRFHELTTQSPSEVW